MVRVRFTDHLCRRLGCEEREVQAATLSEALDLAMRGQEKLADYVLDDQGRLRKHIAVFLDGTLVRERDGRHPIGADAQIYVMQALSGG